jgi:Ricin-type beta-trefoil lectin domain-like
MKLSKTVKFTALLTTLSLASAITALLSAVPKAALGQDSWYIIRAKHSNQCLNILDGSFANGALAVQGKNCKTPNFLWQFRQLGSTKAFRIVARHTEQCLNVLDGSKNNRASVVQGSRCDTGNFNWYFRKLPNGSYHIVNQQTGQCLNVLDGSFNNGARVVQGSRCDTPNFEWSLEPAGTQ